MEGRHNPYREWYRGRIIKANPDDVRDWYVYCVGANGVPVLYIGISTDPKERFEKHKERFEHAPQPLDLRIWEQPLQHIEARRLEIDLHIKYPHAKTITTALNYLLAQAPNPSTTSRNATDQSPTPGRVQVSAECYLQAEHGMRTTPRNATEPK